MFKTTNMFIWFSNGRYIQDDFGQIILKEKPNFSFVYESIKYYWNEKVYSIDESGDELDLTIEQIQEIENFINLKRSETGILKHCVDKNGNYLGIINKDASHVAETITHSPPNADRYIWNFDTKEWYKPYFYNEQGFLCDESNSVGHTKVKPPSTIYPLQTKWDNNSSEWILHDEYNIWNDIVKNRLALECFVDCMTVLLSKSNNTDIFDSLLETLKSNINDEDFKEIFSDYTNLLKKIYSSNKNAFELQELLQEQKNKTSVNIYKSKLGKVDEMNLHFNIKNLNHDDLFY